MKTSKTISILFFVVFLIAGLHGQEKTIILDSRDKKIESMGKIVIEDPITKSIIENDQFLKQLANSNKKFSESLRIRNIDEYSGLNTRQIQNASKLFKENSRAVVLLIAPDGNSMGAGCIINTNGDILTNHHVIRGMKEMLVYLYSNNISTVKDIDPDNFLIADVVAAIPEKDLAYLKVKSKKNFNYLKFGNNSKIDIAQDVFAIGHPESYIWSFTYGVISQLRDNYEWSYDNKDILKANVIQTQTPINPGNSGGPLFNDKGELIGINSFRTGDAEGLNFAVRIDEIEKFIAGLKNGKYKYQFVKKAERKSEIEWEQYDTDKDGRIDEEYADLNNDGKNDVVRYYDKKSGKLYKLEMDSNNDTFIDMTVIDKNKDGKLEYFLMDTNYDRYFDMVGIDTDDDGKPDDFYDY